MRKSLKITMTALAVALTCGFVNEAKAGTWAEGDLALVNLSYFARTGFNISEATAGQDKAYVGLTYQGVNFANPGANVGRVWVGAVYTPAMGWAEMVMPAPKLDAPTVLPIPVVASSSGFPNMIEVRFTTGNPLQGLNTRLIFFRVYADSAGELVTKMWGGDVPGGTAFNEDNAFAPPGSATKDSGPFISICCGNGDLFFGANINLGAKQVADTGGGGTDLSGVDAALAAIEAKLDSLPAGPQGPAGDAGPTGNAGADGATGADGANAPCVDCADVQDAVEELACALAPALQLTNVDDLLASVQSLAVNALLGADVCPNGAGEEAACLATIIDGVQALWDSKQ